MGIPLSAAVGREEGRSPPRIGCQSRAGGAPDRQGAALAPRAGRRVAEGSRSAPPEGKEGFAQRPPHPGRAGLDAAEIHDHLRHSRTGLLCGGVSDQRRIARSRWPRIRCRLRPAALDPGLSQEAPGKEIPQSAAGCRRRHRARHQGRPAAVRIDQGGRRRRARAAQGRIHRHYRNPGDRHAAWRSLRRACSNGCRCRKPTSSAS